MTITHNSNKINKIFNLNKSDIESFNLVRLLELKYHNTLSPKNLDNELGRKTNKNVKEDSINSLEIDPNLTKIINNKNIILNSTLNKKVNNNLTLNKKVNNNLDKKTRLLIKKKTNNIHPHNYVDILGYRNYKDLDLDKKSKTVIINPQARLQGIRRVLTYLKTVIDVYTNANKDNKIKQSCVSRTTLLVITDSLSKLVLPKVNSLNLDKQLNVGSKNSVKVLSLLNLMIARINNTENSNNLKFNAFNIKACTTKEAITYLTNQSKINLDNINNNNLCCGVLIINPTKSKIAELASFVFSNLQTGSKKSSKTFTTPLGILCAKKGVPLISLTDVSSSLNYCTYPILCNTRDLSEVYFVLDLLSFGLTQIISDNSVN